MSKKMAAFMLAGALMVPGAALWAAAGDANQQGANGTTTGTPAVRTPKKHHGHHHKKGAPKTPPAASASGTPGSK